MAQLTKQALLVENNTSFPNNNTGAITPTILRNFNTDMIDSTVNQEAYVTASALVDGRLDNLENFTGSALITGSVSGSTITFTKGNGTTFDLAVTASVASVAWDNVTGKPSGLVSGSSQLTASYDTRYALSGSAGGDTTALNQFTASQETKNTTLATYTGSIDTKFATIGSQSGSWVNTALNTFTASQETKNTTLGGVTASLQQQLTNIGSQSGSWVTESETGSFARTDVSNTFTQTQNITGDLNITGTITATTIHTITESASVIFSSGSNVLGDAADDTQTLNGSVNVVNQLTASGLHYPTTDGTALSYLQTDGVGNLSFADVTTTYDTIHNGEVTTIVKGTPLYVSGSNGANPIVYRADASNPAKMPVTYIAAEDITTNGRGIVLGEIDGINTTGYVGGTTIYVAEGGGWTSTRPSGSASVVQVLGIVTKEGAGGKGLVLNPGPATLPNIQTGYVWVGNSGNQPTAVATSSFASLTDLSLLNAFTASQETKNSTLASYTASVDTKFATIGGLTGSYATTGSNTFTGNQVIGNGSTINVAGDIIGNSSVKVYNQNAGLTLAANAQNSGSQYPGATIIVAPNVYPTDIYGGYSIVTEQGNLTGQTFLGFAANSYTPQYGGTTVPMIVANGYNPAGNDTAIIWKSDGVAEHWKRSDFKYGINVTGSFNLTPASVSTNASYPIPFISGGTISKDSVDTLVYNPSTNQLLVSASTGTATVSANAIVFTSGSGAYGTYASSITKTQIQSSIEGSGLISISGNPSKIGAPSLTNFTKPAILALSGSGVPYVVMELQNSASFSDGRATFLRNVAMLQNLEITGSLTSSLQQGYVWVGDVNGRTTTVPTSSFGGGGGSTFPYSGTASISGSLQVTGSMSGLVNELVVTSNTASIDFTRGNFFSITLAGGTTTRFEIANTILGQTINIQINQPAGASTGSVAFSPTILFAGGNDYQATATGSAIDLLTLAAITGSTVLATSIKNFL